MLLSVCLFVCLQYCCIFVVRLRCVLARASRANARNSGFAPSSIYENDPVLSVGGLTSRREVVAAAPASRRSCAVRRHDAATANLGGHRSSRSIPYSASEVAPRDAKSLPLFRPRVGAALRVAMTPLRQTWKGVDLRDRSRTQRRRSHLATQNRCRCSNLVSELRCASP